MDTSSRFSCEISQSYTSLCRHCRRGRVARIQNDRSIFTVRRPLSGIALHDRFGSLIKAGKETLVSDIQQAQFIHDVFLPLSRHRQRIVVVNWYLGVPFQDFIALKSFVKARYEKKPQTVLEVARMTVVAQPQRRGTSLWGQFSPGTTVSHAV